jgi:cob(I)alamin adenosyltransferase
MDPVEGKIIAYYGKGEGKTTASIGHAIRTLGHNKRVVIHLKKAKEGLELAHRVLAEKQADLLILDEILYAVKFELLTEDNVLELLEKKGPTDIILSGREPGARIIEMADIATHMEKVKHYWNETSSTTSGIKY